MRLYRFAAAVAIAVGAGPAAADPALVAVASNFLRSAQEIAARFEAEEGIKVVLTSGSTGKLYAQITQGAPYDAFLSADEERPLRLEQEGHAVEGSRFTYAYGRLMLWSRDSKYAGRDCAEALRTGEFRRLSIANPHTAPYGVAAVEVLESMDLAVRDLKARIVQGENISQALQFVESGGADLGLVALAQVRQLPGTGADGTCSWQVPQNLHAPIAQQAVLLRRGSTHRDAAAFLAFLRGEAARSIITAHGYAPGA